MIDQNVRDNLFRLRIALLDPGCNDYFASKDAFAYTYAIWIHIYKHKHMYSTCISNTVHSAGAGRCVDAHITCINDGFTL